MASTDRRHRRPGGRRERSPTCSCSCRRRARREHDLGRAPMQRPSSRSARSSESWKQR